VCVCVSVVGGDNLVLFSCLFLSIFFITCADTRGTGWPTSGTGGARTRGQMVACMLGVVCVVWCCAMTSVFYSDKLVEDKVGKLWCGCRVWSVKGNVWCVVCSVYSVLCAVV
jgi:hypothetical protein